MKDLALLLSAAFCGLPAIAHAGDFFTPENPASVGEERRVYGYGVGFSANDIVPISQQNKDWSQGYSPRSGKNAEIEVVNFETGVQWQGYRFGYIWRSDWTVIGNKDTADFIRANRQNASYDVGRAYELDLKTRGFSAEGLRLTKSFSMDMSPGWRFGWGAAGSFLSGLKYGRDDISGRALATAARTSDLSIAWNAQNSNSNILSAAFGTAFPAGNRPSGAGYSFDLGVSVTHESGLRFDWVATDAYGRIKWNDIPQQISVANYAGLVGGSLAITPTRVNLTQTLPVRHSLSLSIPTRMSTLELSDTIYEGINMPRIGLSKRVDADWGTRLDYDFRFSTLGLGINYRWLYVDVRSDSLKLNRAQAYGLSAGVRLDF